MRTANPAARGRLYRSMCLLRLVPGGLAPDLEPLPWACCPAPDLVRALPDDGVQARLFPPPPRGKPRFTVSGR
jgi:hypothetical protein